MANVLQHHIDFHPRPVSHAPSPFGFGFGLSAPTSSSMAPAGWQASPTLSHTNPIPFQQLVSSVNQNSVSRAQKRRHEPDDDIESGRQGSRDDSMDRSPTPERPKRAPPKRARMAVVNDPSLKSEVTTKENKAPGDNEENEIDVGLLLASLPSQSLLPLLTSLLKAQPSLKSTILPLIPRPTVEAAIQALGLSAKRLRDAYPYSTFSHHSTSTNFGLGKSAPLQNIPTFGSANHHVHNGGMRDSYIISRLRPFITEFVAVCFSYLPYFTSVSESTHQHQHQHTESRSITLHSLNKGKSLPSETFMFLSAVTNHIYTQPPLTQASLTPLLTPRLTEEWNNWIEKVDDIVNRKGGMFGSETVRTWEGTLDDLAEGKGSEAANMMRSVRDVWISKVGWLTGRTTYQQMDEL
ncbi:hypothetical protein BDZ94DRAFT_1262044 [Collybia nuda]|uniref:Tethering factor for nuclear proteasome STS1 n=1 Tax=Collybia nuda TaxID=64659 RepID=A0A9P5Y6P1_9AGAR|nr:hypothetical protein BDZ94DRAFT_1262044 [Collybia nuda]